jgi:hypothetical protein
MMLDAHGKDLSRSSCRHSALVTTNEQRYGSASSSIFYGDTEVMQVKLDQHLAPEQNLVHRVDSV